MHILKKEQYIDEIKLGSMMVTQTNSSNNIIIPV